MQHGSEIISYQPKPRAEGEVPPPATEPPAPARHRQRRRALHHRPAPGAVPPRHALPDALLARGAAPRSARRPLQQRAGPLASASAASSPWPKTHFRQAIERLTRRNANPYDGEPYYNLGLCLRHLGRDDEAYAAFYKATWNQAWPAAGYHALAEIDCRRDDWADGAGPSGPLAALQHRQPARPEPEGHRAAQTRPRRRSRRAAAAKPGARSARLVGAASARRARSTATCRRALDLAHDYARAGFFAEAIDVAADARRGQARGDLPDQSWGALPLVHYTLGWLEQQARRRQGGARSTSSSAAALPPDYCFPARLEEIAILEAAMRANPRDARAPYYLGNLLYDRRRHEEAIRLWERSAQLDPDFSVVWRNLGIGYFNIRRQPAKARAAYDRAFRANPADARLLYERDQLWKRLGETPAQAAARIGEAPRPGPAARRSERRTVRALQPDRPAREGARRSSAAATSSRGKAAKAARSASTCARIWRWAARRWRRATPPRPASISRPR